MITSLTLTYYTAADELWKQTIDDDGEGKDKIEETGHESTLTLD
jgi:hypothetical protein